MKAMKWYSKILGAGLLTTALLFTACAKSGSSGLSSGNFSSDGVNASVNNDTLNGVSISMSMTNIIYMQSYITFLMTLNGSTGNMQVTSGSFTSAGSAGTLAVYVAGGVNGNFIYTSAIIYAPNISTQARQYTVKKDNSTGKIVAISDNLVTTSTYAPMTTIMASM